MRLLLATTAFAPTLGGVETVAALLARAFKQSNYEIVVVTTTPGGSEGDQEFQVYRNPGLLRLWRLYQASDAVIVMGPTLRLGWPLLLTNRLAVISHQGFLPAHGQQDHSIGRLRGRLLRRAVNVACSEVVAASLPVPCAAIGNPYDDIQFRELPGVPRTGALLFVGRLVREKGVDLLLEALSLLAGRDVRPELDIAGPGPMRAELEHQVQARGLTDQVEFLGPVVGKNLVELLNGHKILVVPSTWIEPFGIVALEGIACGCVVIGSNGGGLAQAIGPCGVTFPNGDAQALASVIQKILSDTVLLEQYHNPAQSHLAKHRPAQVASRYLEVMRGEG